MNLPGWLQRAMAPAPDSLAAVSIRRGKSPWTHGVHLLWTVWIFLTPLLGGGYGGKWVVLTLLSYPVFLWLYAKSVVAPLPVDAAADAQPAPAEVASPSAGINAADFSIAYQPIFDLRSETLIGVEALLRWTRAEAGDVAQEDLPTAERLPLLEQAGIIALRRAADELAPLGGLMLTMAVTPEQVRSGRQPKPDDARLEKPRRFSAELREG